MSLPPIMRRFVITAFLCAPGLIIWGLGLIIFAAEVIDAESHQPISLSFIDSGCCDGRLVALNLAAVTFIAILGYGMYVAAQSLVENPRFRLGHRHLVAYTALTALQQFILALGIGHLFAPALNGNPDIARWFFPLGFTYILLFVVSIPMVSKRHRKWQNVASQIPIKK